MSDPELAVIFDLDGLLADTEPFWIESSSVLLARRGRVYDPSLKRVFMGRRPLEVVHRMIAHYGLTEPAEELLAERLRIQHELYATGEIVPMPGALELVGALERQRVPMAVASGSPVFLMRTVLERIGLLRRLPVHVSSEQVERGKPAPDLFLLAARLLGVPPAACVVLEDAIAGVEAALAAQMTVVAVPGSEIPSEAYAAAHLVVRGLDQLSPQILAGVAKVHPA
jgi:HAD superfamily hydrolase (TIGR01509 family)